MNMNYTGSSGRGFTILTAGLLSLVLTACSSSDDDNPVNDDPDGMQEPVTQYEIPAEPEIQGVWEKIGYGIAVRIDNDLSELFEFTRASCFRTAVLGSDFVDEILATAKISADKMSLEIVEPGELFSESYVKREVLPEFCEETMIIQDSTPVLVFDHLWNSFNDYYAFFTERQVDWEAQRAIYRPEISDDMTNEQLFELLSEMLDPLDDGHVELVADTNNFEAEFSPSDDVSLFRAELAESFNQQTEFDDTDDYYLYQMDRVRQVSFQSVNDLKQAGPEIEGFIPAAVYWGTLDGNIGYINITRMVLFDETLDLENNGLNNFELEQDLKALNKILDGVMSDLQDTRAMVVDVRTNGGGTDSASIEISNRFATDNLQVINKFARYFNGETAVKHALTTAVSNPYVSPVAVLSSMESASAAEIFLMTMNSLSNVTLVGDESAGELSDVLDKSLPNGWEVSLSNEVYSDYQDKRFEVTGVPVGVKVKALSLPDIENKVDAALSRALALF